MDTFMIRFEGHLDATWSDWMGNLAMTHLADGSTLMSGPLPDQSALYGLLARLRDLGLPLLLVVKANPTDPVCSHLYEKCSDLC